PASEVAILDPLGLVPVEMACSAAAVDELDLAVETVAAEIDQSPATLEHPGLDGVVHLPRPVLGMLVEDEHAVGVEVEDARVELVLRVQVERDSFALQPTHEAPRRRCDVLRADLPHRRGDLLGLADAVDGFRAIEGERRVVVVPAIPPAAA